MAEERGLLKGLRTQTRRSTVWK